MISSAAGGWACAPVAAPRPAQEPRGLPGADWRTPSGPPADPPSGRSAKLTDTTRRPQGSPTPEAGRRPWGFRELPSGLDWAKLVSTHGLHVKARGQPLHIRCVSACAPPTDCPNSRLLGFEFCAASRETSLLPLHPLPNRTLSRPSSPLALFEHCSYCSTRTSR